MEPTPKKPRPSDAVTAPLQQRGLSTLPPSVVSTIFSYLLHEVELKSVCADYSPHTQNFLRLATVSKDWHSFADEAASEHALRYVLFRYRKRMTRQLMLEMRRTLTLRRGHVREINLRGVPDFGAFTRDAWAAALSHTPRLQVIDFDTFDYEPPSVSTLAQIVQAAAQHCPTMEKLLFSQYTRPPPSRAFVVSDSKQALMRELTGAVFDAMKVWSKHGGLRQLHLGMHDFIKSHKDAKEYLDNVIAYAPNIHVLNGSSASTAMTHFVHCKERWLLDLEAWERFCRTCDQLVHFEWVPVPFATEFFEIFAKYPKKNLKQLTLTTAANWSWKKYFRTVDANTKTALEASGHGAAARNVYKVVEACPNLVGLNVDWFDEPNARGLKKCMNAEVFGDDFCEALARCCKRLATLSIVPAESLFSSRKHSSLLTLTDQSMVALASLPELLAVEIGRVNITGDGLFELVVNHKANTRQGREYTFNLGDGSRGETSKRFYGGMLGFLERLAAHEGEIPCVSRPVVLQLINNNQSRVDEGFSAEYFAKCLMLVDKIKQKHPTVQLRGLVRGYDSEYCVVRCIMEFYFATAGVTVPDWVDPDEDVLKDTPIDDVFVDRKYVDGERSDDEDSNDGREGEEDDDEDVFVDDNDDDDDHDDDSDSDDAFSDDMDGGFEFDDDDGDY